MTSTVDTQQVLARVMRDRGYANPQDLAAASGMPYNTLYRWATGKSNPHRRSLVSLLDALGLNPDDYGVPRPEPAKTPASSGEDALNRQMRHDVAMLRAELSIARADIRALLDHFQIEAPKHQEIKS